MCGTADRNCLIEHSQLTIVIKSGIFGTIYSDISFRANHLSFSFRIPPQYMFLPVLSQCLFYDTKVPYEVTEICDIGLRTHPVPQMYTDNVRDLWAGDIVEFKDF